MIQFNLLPDVKKEYVKAKRTKRLIISGSIVVSAAVVVVTTMMFTYVHIAQKKNISDLSKDIERVNVEIKSTEDLDNILTVQNQLSILPGLHASKPETSRLFDYLTFASPGSVRVSTVDLDTESSTLEIAGFADSIATINKFVDNIKATEHVVVGRQDSTKTYSNVVTELTGANDGATFTLNMSYDPAIFDNTLDVVLRLGAQRVQDEQSGQEPQ